LLLEQSWHGLERLHRVIAHVDLIGDKFWIQQDLTPTGIGADLERAGQKTGLCSRFTRSSTGFMASTPRSECLRLEGEKTNSLGRVRPQWLMKPESNLDKPEDDLENMRSADQSRHRELLAHHKNRAALVQLEDGSSQLETLRYLL
jgi:hypothetical protein